METARSSIEEEAPQPATVARACDDVIHALEDFHHYLEAKGQPSLQQPADSRVACGQEAVVSGGELALACGDVAHTFQQLRQCVEAKDAPMVEVSKARHKRSIDQLMSVLDSTAAVPPGKRAMREFCVMAVNATSMMSRVENISRWRRRWNHATLEDAKTEKCSFCAHASTAKSLMGKRQYWGSSSFKKILCLECYEAKEAKRRLFFMEQDSLSKALVQYNVLTRKALLAADTSRWIRLGDAVGAVVCSTCFEQAAYVFFESRNLACLACFDKLCAEKDCDLD